MPHNRTRLWVGLAIIAITIPVAAQYYYGSASRASSSLAVEATTPRDADEVALDERLTVRPSDRDYLGEVSSALSKGGSKPLPGDTERSSVPIIFSGPIDAIMSQVQPEETVQPVYEDDMPPVPARLATRQAPAVVPDDEIVDEDEPVAEPGLSDRTVYQLVVDNLPEEDRDTFVTAWAVMTPEERASLLDEWRANLSN
ncbi:hypothetical protein EON82_11220 [bacterium]|nr:MAG: hypothetical protein EON82_11220 [bacterium]